MFDVTSKMEKEKTKTFISTGEVEILAPLEYFLASSSACEISSINFTAKQNSVKIEKIEVNMKGQYDPDYFTGKKEGNNTFDKIDIITNIFSSEKDRSKLDTVVNKGIQRCPMISTLNLAGVKMNKIINYL